MKNHQPVEEVGEDEDEEGTRNVEGRSKGDRVASMKERIQGKADDMGRSVVGRNFGRLDVEDEGAPHTERRIHSLDAVHKWMNS